VTITPDDRFRLDGDDIRTTHSLPLHDVLDDIDAAIPSLRGGLVVRIPRGTRHGDEVVVKGQGFPSAADASRNGDLRVIVAVGYPASLNPEQRAAWDAWRSLMKRGDTEL
jgi:DnaJ-class molecular chaperone